MINETYIIGVESNKDGELEIVARRIGNSRIESNTTIKGPDAKLMYQLLNKKSEVKVNE